ncbi:malate dehydrogenase [Gloeocapsopsis dulcis]|uniref:Malate dehydrogenase n=1 Tax=Gloeocapsopsis dulcis AAB1 = 1H9 TaxID=1433147 RepID=A0A6N8G2H4_9CHRO|nr:malate dehydrogenase [Gloeocapsopsis dulcis]MUL38376.1 malate dehydrogenase [Gloeocapsopsis dulcis AAB1 = 1H9]WNN91581.1 malate dehydrogenase [Gloeocapsopsis dulcis]
MPIASTSSQLVSSSPRVTIVGAGKVGSTLAQQIGEKNLADVVLLDEVEGLPQGLALDLMEAKGISQHSRQFIGTTNYTDTAGSDIVVITAGQPRKPGMSRDALLKTNAKIVVETATNAIAYSPDAILIVVTNPLDVMTSLAWQATQLPTQRVLGMAGVLDSARFQAFVAMELGISIADVRAIVLGSHGDLMVPLPRYSTVNGVPITELIDTTTIERLVERTRKGGAEIVELMQTGSAYFAPAASTLLMVEAILLNQFRLLPVAAYLQGEYGLHDIFIGVPTLLGAGGVEKILELQLTDTEIAALHLAAQEVRQNIEQARSLVKIS